jgi:hypothetical protein
MLLGIMALSIAIGQASQPGDATITVDRAIDSPTLTVKYTGARASLVELRINGESIATRSISTDKDNGETSFTLDLSSLKDGENAVEVRLYDRTGRMIGTDKSILNTDDTAPAPFYMDQPRMGATVLGPIEISVGMNKSFHNSFVSFFVDNKLRAMTNTPPFTYLWDTAKESNGWHELESWLVDDSTTTYRSKKVKVFVNNPSGDTNREKEPVLPTPTTVVVKPTPFAAPTSNGHAAAAGVEALSALAMQTTGAMIALKPVLAGQGIATGPKLLTPTGTRLATNARPHFHTSGPVANVTSAVHLLPITKGSRIPNIATFAVLMNGSFVDFDVQPRVDEGVPMTPLRFLFEREGGSVDWHNLSQTVTANADGHSVFLKIGDASAKVDSSDVSMERAAYLDSGRTIVPLSFIHDALKVNVQYDKATGHVLITSAKK